MERVIHNERLFEELARDIQNMTEFIFYNVLNKRAYCYKKYLFSSFFIVYNISFQYETPCRRHLKRTDFSNSIKTQNSRKAAVTTSHSSSLSHFSTAQFYDTNCWNMLNNDRDKAQSKAKLEYLLYTFPYLYIS